MATRNDTGHVTLTAAAALSEGQRVYINSSGQAAVATAAAKAEGTVVTGAASAGLATVKLLSAGGTHQLIAAEAISVGDRVWGAAAGKVSLTPTGTESWRALTAASGDGVEFEAAVWEAHAPSGQGAPAAKTGAATVAAADIAARIVTLSHATGGTVALTLDTGANMDAYFVDVPIGGTVEWSIINTSAAAADTGTLTASSGHTIVGAAIVQSAHSSTGGVQGNAARWLSRRTAASTWVTYRIA